MGFFTLAVGIAPLESLILIDPGERVICIVIFVCLFICSFICLFTSDGVLSALLIFCNRDQSLGIYSSFCYILEGMVAYGRLLLAPTEGWCPSATFSFRCMRGPLPIIFI